MKKIVTKFMAVAIAFTTLVSMSGVMTVNAEAATKSNVTVKYNNKSVKKPAVKSVSVTVDGAEKASKKVTVYLTGNNKVKVDTAVNVTVNGKKSKASKSLRTNAGKVTYDSSNKAVATVSSKGVITAKKAGKTTITVKSKANSKKYYKIALTVKNGVKKMTLNSKTKITLTEGNKTSFTPKVSTYKNVKKTIVASTSNKSVATVKAYSSGKVTITAKKAGKAVITVAPKYGSDKARKITVTVKAKPAPAQKEYKTQVVFADVNAKKVALTGTVSWTNQAKLQDAVRDFAKAIGGNYTLTVGGKSATVTNGVISAAELAKIPVSGEKKDVTVEADITIAQALALVEKVDPNATAKFDGQFTLGGVTVSNVSLANKAVTFKLGDATLTAYVEGGNLYLDGDQSALFKTYETIYGANKTVVKEYKVVEK